MTANASPAGGNDQRAIFRDNNFRWLLGGGAVSMLGDQFTLIALPWLVLKMTGDTLALGTVLALTGLPRALFMLVGGALVDRHSPKTVLMLTKYVNAILLGLLAALVLTGALQLWMVYGLALAIGLSTAFSIPAGTSILPHVLAPHHLEAANGLLMGLRQLTMFAGPLLAGLLIVLGGDGHAATSGEMRGLGLAFLFDAATFVLSAWTLARVAMLQVRVEAGRAPQAQVLQAIMEGLRFCWRDRSLRTCFLYWSAVALFISGPIQVAMPVLAGRLGGAAAFGILMGVHGAGTLLGMLVAGLKPRWRPGSLGLTILAVDAAVGALFIPLGLIGAVWQGAALLVTIGVLGGFLQVLIFGWMQRRVPKAMMGRAMSVFMFIFMGIAPLSAALTGWLMRSVTLAGLFAGSGLLLLAIVAIALLASAMPDVNDEAGPV